MHAIETLEHFESSFPVLYLSDANQNCFTKTVFASFSILKFWQSDFQFPIVPFEEFSKPRSLLKE